MITSIILIILIVLCIGLTKLDAIQYSFEDCDTVIMIFKFIFIILLLFHILFISTKKYDCDLLIIKRNAIESSLIESRKQKNNLESATITSKIIDFNNDLNEYKYYKSIPFFNKYIDDRINNIKEIK